MTTRIAILGDFNPVYQTHHRLNDSVKHISKLFSEDLQFDWIGTDIFDAQKVFGNLYSGLWIAPGSPYKDMHNVLNAIKYVRENNIPTLGNCGGFQHMIIEFARNVCGIKNADHEETNPGATDLIISKLSCSLVGMEEEITIIDTNSILYNTIKKTKLVGKYFCSYGMNEKYVSELEDKGLSFTAKSADNQFRALEIKSHRFFIGTLFQPALTSTINEPDPVIVEFTRQCLS